MGLKGMDGNEIVYGTVSLIMGMTEGVRSTQRD